MSLVYVLCFGERSEGQIPEAVFASLEDAKAHAQSAPYRPASDWEFIPPHSVLRPRMWLGDAGGVDEWWIYEMEVAS